jgi:hypothetical protein
MKTILPLLVIAMFFSGCRSLNSQVDQIKALEKCKFEVSSVDSIYAANVNVRNLRGREITDLLKAPRLALAIMRKNVPLKARINLVINNPTSQLAAINQFEYKVLIKSRELAGGLVNQKIAVSPNGGTTTVPIRINSNIYHILSDDKAMDAITDFLIGSEDNDKERRGMITIKIKPTLDFGNKQIKYPGYITIDKEVSSKNLF